MKKPRRRSYSTREHPEAAGLEASLHHVSGWPVLSITDSPQTLELELVNRMPHPVTAGPAYLWLRFRPGILTALEKIALAPQSEAAWLLKVHPPKPHAVHGDVALELAGVKAFTLAPGESIAIRIDGISADAAGGSRATRVQLDYGRFFLESGVEAAGSQLMHLPVLRRHEPAGLPATELRTGSTAVSGPFLAGFLDGPDLLNDDGKTENTLTLRIINTTGRPIPLSDDGDAATRFYVSFRTGAKDAEWGLLGSHSDHLDLVAKWLATDPVEQKGWQVDNHTIRRTDPAPWERDDFLDLELTVFTAARTGDAQVIVNYENLPAHDDGDLVLLAHLGPVATRKDSVVVAAPVEVRSDVNLKGELVVTGAVRSGANHPVIAPAQFKLGGSIDRFYPVVFEDLGWERGEFRFEVFRARTHVDGEWRGSMMAKIVCHNDNFGHGSGYWSIEIRQSTASGRPTRYFVGGFTSYPYAPQHVLWLAGDTTYSWLANHEARIAAPVDFDHPDVVRVGEGETLESYPVKTAPDGRFHAEYVSISESLGRDTGPVPKGAILMWSGSMDKIPLGWALCDGSNGTPDLRGRFIVGSGKGTYDHGESFDFPAAPPLESKPAAGQTGGRLKVPLSLSEMPRHQHTGKTNNDGAHYHHVPVWANEDRNKTEYPPGNRYLFKDLNQAYNRTPDRAPTTSKHPSEHEHGFTTESAGGNAPHENLPPFFALCFIMKL